MNRLFALPFIVLSAPTLAHPGHVAVESGHTHWVALGATVLAVAIAAIGIGRAIARRRRRRSAHG